MADHEHVWQRAEREPDCASYTCEVTGCVSMLFCREGRIAQVDAEIDARVALKRMLSLTAYGQALLQAIEQHMPAGYPGAGDDRLRFLAPVEQVLVELRSELGKG